MDFEKLILDNYKSIGDMDMVLQVIRDNGASQLQSTQLLINVLGFSLKDADQIIINSHTWRDLRQMNEDVRDAFFDVLEDEDEDE